VVPAQAAQSADSLAVTRAGPALVQSSLSPFGDVLALWREPGAGAIPGAARAAAIAAAGSSHPPPAPTLDSRGVDVWVGITSRGYVLVWSAGAALDSSGGAFVPPPPPASASVGPGALGMGLGVQGGGPVNPAYLPTDTQLMDFEKILGENYRRLTAACFTLPKIAPPGATAAMQAQTAQLQMSATGSSSSGISGSDGSPGGGNGSSAGSAGSGGLGGHKRGSLSLFVLTEEGHGLTYSVELGVIATTTVSAPGNDTEDETLATSSAIASGAATPNPAGLVTAVADGASSSLQPSRRVGIVAHRRLLLRKALYQRDGLPSNLSASIASSGLSAVAAAAAHGPPPRPSLVCFDPLSNCILLCVDSELLAVADQTLQTGWSANVAPAILGGSLAYAAQKGNARSGLPATRATSRTVAYSACPPPRLLPP